MTTLYKWYFMKDDQCLSQVFFSSSWDAFILSSGQFLEDMETFTEEAQGISPKEEKKLVAVLEKIILLLR